MPKGGPRAGAGRPPGAKNKVSVSRDARAAAERAREEMEAAVGAGSLQGKFWGNAHDLFKLVYRDLSQPLNLRMEAAKQSIKYETPALASVEMKGANGGPVQMVTREMTAVEAAEAYAKMIKGEEG